MLRAPSHRTLAVVAIAFATVTTTATSASAKTFNVSMNGKVEVPKGDPDGSGTARLTTNPAKRRICFDIKLSNVGSVNAGHIHEAAKGKAGDVVVPLFGSSTNHPKGCAKGLKKSQIRDIERNPGDYYVNVHTAAYPAGAVRGQLHG